MTGFLEYQIIKGRGLMLRVPSEDAAAMIVGREIHVRCRLVGVEMSSPRNVAPAWLVVTPLEVSVDLPTAMDMVKYKPDEVAACAQAETDPKNGLLDAIADVVMQADSRGNERLVITNKLVEAAVRWHRWRNK